MEYNQQLQERFDRYLNNKMTAKEVIDFEAELTQDKELVKLLEFHRKVILSVKKVVEKESGKKKFDQLREQYTAKQAKVKQRRLTYIRIGIAAAAVITFLVIWLSPIFNPVEIEAAAGRAIHLDTLSVYNGTLTDRGLAITDIVIEEVPLAVYRESVSADSYRFDGKFLMIYSTEPEPFVEANLLMIQLPDESLLLKTGDRNYRVDTALSLIPLKRYLDPLDIQ